MKILSRLLLAISVLVSFHFSQAARWGETVYLGQETDVDKIKSQPLKDVYRAYMKSMDDMIEEYQVTTYPDHWVYVTDLHYKKKSEPLRNSIKQLHFIQSSDWYCDVETDVALAMQTLINAKTVEEMIEGTIGMGFAAMEVSLDEDIYNEFVNNVFQSVIAYRGIEMVGSETRCTDEWADQWTFNIYDGYSKELLQISVGSSE